MINPTQVATVVIGAMLSAGVFSTSFDAARAAPTATSKRCRCNAGTCRSAGGQGVRDGGRTAAPTYSAAPSVPIFSRGIDRLTERIEQAGVTASVMSSRFAA